MSGKERYFFSVDSAQLALLVFNSYTDQNFENTFFYVKYLSNSYDAALVDQLKNVSNKLVLDSADRVHPISGYTTLHLAATCGDVFTLDILLSGEELPNINALTEDNNSPLILAALNGHLTTILVLLKNGDL